VTALLRTWSILKEERPLRRLQHPISPNQEDLIMHRATKESELTDSDALKESELTDSDALIVKAYTRSASKCRLAVLMGGFMVADESRTR
jgi:hypothetical protein